MVEKEIFVVVIFMVTLDNMLDGIRVIDDKGWPENEAYTDNIPILVAELYKKTRSITLHLRRRRPHFFIALF